MAVMTMIFGGDYRLDFQLESHPIADQWLAKMQARDQWPLDDPTRFYGFDDQEAARADAEQRLVDCMTTINSHEPIIQRPWTSIDDQDLLNYLHNIFERYHGLLDRQDTDWWKRAPETVRSALANLNIAVHRAESVSRSRNPRLVCTWFGMPKDSQLQADHMIQHGRLSYEFGGVYLNYVEIGKTLEDLSIDDDHYIGHDAFQPFLKFSADFHVRFYDAMPDIARVYRYFEQHREFFKQRGIDSFDDYRTMPRRYKVAQLLNPCDRPSVIRSLSQRQRVTDIYFSCDKPD